ncbi:MAG: NAD(P)(+) transhydrogenase (Re/Si-specific) subunit beta [Candidatus Woesearchaeota archaeon]
MSYEIIINLAYLLSAVFFILGIKNLGKVATARRGNALAVIGMIIALSTVLIDIYIRQTTAVGWIIIVSALFLGSVVGMLLSQRIQMTAMPQLVAIFNGLGGGASLLVASVYFSAQTAHLLVFDFITVVLSCIIGAVTLTGSIIAFGKLQGIVSSKPFLFKGSSLLNVFLAVAIIGTAIMLGFAHYGNNDSFTLMVIMIGIALLLGILLVTPIGGADMPVVIALLNSYSGIAAAMAGFVIQNMLLIIGGSLVGASGLILTRIMCKAMNRSLTNVLFGGFGQEQTQSTSGEYQNVKECSAEEAASILESAQSVVVVPGYGMAVAQAQNAVHDVMNTLSQKNVDMHFAIHPVAGRMPGHMNVLLAEADIPYDKLCDLDQGNALLKTADVAIVVGANDVVNPVAAHDKSSPIYGMPILNVHDAQTVIVIKRSLSAGFAGVKNELFEKDNTLMLYGDAKKVLQDVNHELKEG